MWVGVGKNKVINYLKSATWNFGKGILVPMFCFTWGVNYWEYFFQSSSRNLAASVWKAALWLGSPDRKNVLIVVHVEALRNQTTMLSSHGRWIVCWQNHYRGWILWQALLQTLLPYFYKYIWKRMVPMYVTNKKSLLTTECRRTADGKNKTSFMSEIASDVEEWEGWDELPIN